MDTTLLYVLVTLAAIAIVLLIVLLIRSRGETGLREKLDALRSDSERVERALREEQRSARTELAETLDRMGGQLRLSLSALTTDNQQRLAEVRTTLDTQLKALQTDNATQLEKMREVVDEKLQKTLETRLSSSFKQIAERLEAVQRGLGEMQSLAT
ncbi:MAG TPA: DNA recombination protein RmuC, partial [Rhodanobacteraceae bacterium]